MSKTRSTARAKCNCTTCRLYGGVHDEYKPRKWRLSIALERYLERWQRARAARVEKCIADILGHAREHTAIVEVPPRHTMSMHVGDSFAGINRGVHPEPLQWARQPSEPFTLEQFKQAILSIFAAPVLPPVKPWISRQRAAQLVSEGISMRMLETVFEIY